MTEVQSLENQIEERIRIVLADEDAIFVGICRALIEPQPDMEVVGETCDVAAVFSLTERLQPDILLLGLCMGGQGGFRILAQIQTARLNTRAIAICEGEQGEDSVRAARLGCRGVVPKNTSGEMILKSVRKVHAGELWLDRTTAAEVLRQFTDELQSVAGPRDRSPNAVLSPREREIVGLVTQGLKNRELAEKLRISEQTVKNHMHNIFDKLGVSDRLELALYAIHRGL